VGSAVYEWIEAAHWDNMSYSEFSDQPVDYKERIIAAYRIHIQKEAVIAKAIKPKGK